MPDKPDKMDSPPEQKPDPEMKPPNSTELARLQGIARYLGKVDIAKLKAEVGDSDEGREKVEQVLRDIEGRAHLTMGALILQGNDPLRPSTQQAETSEKRIVGFEELMRFIRAKVKSFTVNTKILGTAKNEGERLEFPEVYLRINERFLRKIPEYGPNFRVDTSKLQYHGNPDKLVKAFQYGLVDNMILDVWPERVRHTEMRMVSSQWLQAKMTSANKWHLTSPGKVHFESPRMHKVLGTGQVKFVCSFEDGNTVRDYNFPLDEELPRLGGRYLDFTSLLHYLHSLPASYGDYIVVDAEGKKYRVSFTQEQDHGASLKFYDLAQNSNSELAEDSAFLI